MASMAVNPRAWAAARRSHHPAERVDAVGPFGRPPPEVASHQDTRAGQGQGDGHLGNQGELPVAGGDQDVVAEAGVGNGEPIRDPVSEHHPRRGRPEQRGPPVRPPLTHGAAQDSGGPRVFAGGPVGWS